LAGSISAIGLQHHRALLRGRRTLSESSSGSFTTEEPRGSGPLPRDHGQRARAGLRRRRRSFGRGGQGWQHHLSRPAADAFRGRHVVAQPRRNGDLRREVDPQSQAVDRAPWWPSLAVAEAAAHAMLAHLAQRARFPGAADIIRMAGLRVEYSDGFGLARASNTTPVIVLRFEANDAGALARIQGEFRRVFNESLPGQALPF